MAVRKLFIGDFVLDVVSIEPHEPLEPRPRPGGVFGTATLALNCYDGEIPVRFQARRVEPMPRQKETYRILEGVAQYPEKDDEETSFLISKEGFPIAVESLTITPEGAKAALTIRLPECMADASDCGNASLNLDDVDFSAACEFSADRPDEAFGPWIVGSTGLVISGKGFDANFAPLNLPIPLPHHKPGIKGLVLREGTASGHGVVSDYSNTGFLVGEYRFSNARVTAQGLSGAFTLNQQVTFHPSNPRGYTVTAIKGEIRIEDCRIKDGSLMDGEVLLPADAILDVVHTGQPRARFSQLAIDENLDVAGEVHFDGARLGWGDLSSHGGPLVAWSVEAVNLGYLYLPGGPCPTYCPDTGNGFVSVQFSDPPLTVLKAQGIAGVTVIDLQEAQIHSLDHYLERKNPIPFHWIRGWIHFGCSGIDGMLLAVEAVEKDKYGLGNPDRPGYAGRVWFDSSFNLKREMLLGRFISSAVCDSNLQGTLTLPGPCNFELPFAALMATSTADLVGGDIGLPPGTKFDYWKLDLVSTGNPDKAGVLSLRTGRIILTSAGIAERRHFAQPFRITWGEILPTGDIGELFFDFNSFGQMFDLIPFSPHRLLLSPFVQGSTDGYLTVGGTVHLNFLGNAYVNIRDARNDAQPGDPFYGRKVTVPKSGESGWSPTDLTLHGTWNAEKAVFDYPDISMDYHHAAQNGFLGTGTSTIFFLHSLPLESTVEIHADTIDMRVTSTSTHDLDFGLMSRLGGLSQIYGCARVKGPLLKRITIQGLLERSGATGMGILAPKAGACVETLLSVTPTSCTFYAAGEMTASVSVTEVDIFGSAYVSIDYARPSMEGQFQGRIDGGSASVAVAGEGQVTWFMDPTMMSLQGNLKVAVNSWIGGAEMEGGLFLGIGVPKEKAWILQVSSPHYGLSTNLLPHTLTGIYAYGRAAFGINFYIFGGGIELYAGMGAFLDFPPGQNSVFDTTGFPLPYFFGRGGFYLHGEILGGLVSAEGWATLQLYGPVPLYFEGQLGLRGCILWVLCASVSVTAGISSEGFYLE